MKRCYNCKDEKEETEFRKNKTKSDGLQSICAECSKKRNKKWYKDNLAHKLSYRKTEVARKQKWLREFKKTLRCSRCSETHPRCLEFHHRNPDEKNGNISAKIRNWGLDRIKAEIELCIVLCSNCHRKETFKDDIWCL